MNRIDGFLKYLREHKYNESTINGYYFGLKSFFNYLTKNNISAVKFTSEDVVNYKNTLINKNSEQTVNVKLFAIKKYTEFLNLDWKWDVAVIKNNRKRDFIPVENIRKFLDYIKEVNSDNFIRKRDELIMKMLYYTGIRIQDLIKIKKGDINDNVLKIGARDVILCENLFTDIINYINLAEIQNNEYLFFSSSQNNRLSSKKIFNKNKHISARSIENIFNKYKSAVGSNLSISDLRNSHIFNLKNKILKIIIDKIYSHISIESNDVYLKIQESKF